MHIITRTRLRRFWEEHREAETALRLWYQRASQAEWRNLIEVQKVYPSADRVGRLTVFDIRGNNYRLIVRIEYEWQQIYIRHVLTHDEYSRDGGKMMIGSNLTYAQLVAAFPPRPITSEEQFWATQEHIDVLVDKGDLTPDEQDYLAALGMMVTQYEDLHEPDIKLRGLDLIRALMEEQGLSQRDLVLPVFKTDSIASAVLNRKRRLTAEHIDKLATYFDMPHAWFFESQRDDTLMAVTVKTT